MNYQETIERLEKKQDQLLNDNATWKPPYTFFGRTTPGGWKWNFGSDKEKGVWLMIDGLKKSYQKSMAEEISNDKIDEEFKSLEGFTKQKQEVKSLLMFKNYAKVKNISSPQRGKIMCFIGPPGVGKTLFAKKLAKAMGRKFFRINVGGEGNANIITGGKTEHVGAKVGKIIQAIRETESRDPVILIDEVEKTTKAGREEGLKDALLHVLDPEQNKEFTDNYINVAVDISEITFILTANEESKIPGPLKNRLEIITLKGYNESQKINIGKIIIDETFSENYGNANRDLFEMEEEALKTLIQKNKEEEGVRQLKRGIEEIIRWCFGQWAQMNEKGWTETKIVIDVKKVNELFPEEKKEEKEDSEEDKLRQKIEELEQENEKLSKKPLTLQLSKQLEISPDKEFCSKHQKDTLHSSEKNCLICELDQFTQQQEAIISKENLATWENIWFEQKEQLIKQSEQLARGSAEEKHLAQQIKASIKKIDKKRQQVRKTNQPTPATENKNGKSADLPWIIGLGIAVVSIGLFYGWLLTKIIHKKKKKNKKNKKKFTTEKEPTPKK